MVDIREDENFIESIKADEKYTEDNSSVYYTVFLF